GARHPLQGSVERPDKDQRAQPRSRRRRCHVRRVWRWGTHPRGRRGDRTADGRGGEVGADGCQGGDPCRLTAALTLRAFRPEYSMSTKAPGKLLFPWSIACGG